MDQGWAQEELCPAELGDTRLNQRLVQLAESFSRSPESPINQACRDWGETKGAYRFFQNENVNYKAILNGHVQSTVQRCKDHELILVIQDTAFLNYTSHPKTEGMCIFNSNMNKLSSQGLIMHTSLALTTEGLPLGILNQNIYSRPSRTFEERQLRKIAYERKFIPLKEKDSMRWLKALEETISVLGQNIKTVTICDREADIYDFFLLAEQINSSVLVRANHDRRNKGSAASRQTGATLWPYMEKQACMGLLTITIPKKEKVPSRSAILEVRTGKFQFNPGRDRRGEENKNLPDLTLNAIYLKEKNVPAESEAIEWMLLTNLPVLNFEDAVEKIRWYCLRWRIEVFHKILKSGLKVEDCRLSTADRLIRYLSLMSIIAWRIFWITLLAREIPQAAGRILLNDMEWKILFAKINPRKQIPHQPPDIKTCVRWIAQLGGFLARKCDKDPGIIHVWRGLRKFADILEGVELAKRFVGNS